jgi:beta-mannanase
MYQTGAPWSWGQYTSVEAQINRHSAIVHWYAQWGNQSGVFNPSTLNLLNSVRQHGSLPLITWEPWVGPPATNNPFPLKGIAAGQFDTYIDSWATGLAAYAHPIMLRWGPEMQGNWLPWGANINGNTPADFIAAYRHIHDRFVKAGASKVQWVFGADGDPNGGFPPLGLFYPGDAYVDWLGSDIYNVGTTQQYGTWQPMSARLQLSYNRLTALNPTKPIVLAEFGTVEQGGNKAAWVQEAAVDLPRLFPRVKAVVWFSEGIYSLTTSPAAIAGERAAFGAAPFCLTLPY